MDTLYVILLAIVLIIVLLAIFTFFTYVILDRLRKKKR